jgi:hypothetical protein
MLQTTQKLGAVDRSFMLGSMLDVCAHTARNLDHLPHEDTVRFLTQMWRSGITPNLSVLHRPKPVDSGHRWEWNDRPPRLRVRRDVQRWMSGRAAFGSPLPVCGVAQRGKPLAFAFLIWLYRNAFFQRCP